MVQVEVSFELAYLQPKRNALLILQTAVSFRILNERFQVHSPFVQINRPGLIIFVIFDIEIYAAFAGLRNYLFYFLAYIFFRYHDITSLSALSRTFRHLTTM